MIHQLLRYLKSERSERTEKITLKNVDPSETLIFYASEIAKTKLIHIDYFCVQKREIIVMNKFSAIMPNHSANNIRFNCHSRRNSIILSEIGPVGKNSIHVTFIEGDLLTDKERYMTIGSKRTDFKSYDIKLIFRKPSKLDIDLVLAFACPDMADRYGDKINSPFVSLRADFFYMAQTEGMTVKVLYFGTKDVRRKLQHEFIKKVGKVDALVFPTLKSLKSVRKEFIENIIEYNGGSMIIYIAK